MSTFTPRRTVGRTWVVNIFAQACAMARSDEVIAPAANPFIPGAQGWDFVATGDFNQAVIELRNRRRGRTENWPNVITAANVKSLRFGTSGDERGILGGVRGCVPRPLRMQRQCRLERNIVFAIEDAVK